MRSALSLAAIAAAALALMAGRVLWSSRVELRDAEARAAAGETVRAVEALGRAARLDAPGNPFSARARAGLEERAIAAEALGDRPLALAAWRELRSALLATRHLDEPHRPLRLRADEHIAGLAAALESPAVDPGADEAARTRWHAARLAEDDAPHAGWSLAAVLSLALFIACSLGLLLRGLDADLRIRRGPALRFGAGVGLGFALLLLALVRA